MVIHPITAAVLVCWCRCADVLMWAPAPLLAMYMPQGSCTVLTPLQDTRGSLGFVRRAIATLLIMCAFCSRLLHESTIRCTGPGVVQGRLESSCIRQSCQDTVFSFANGDIVKLKDEDGNAIVNLKAFTISCALTCFVCLSS